MADGPDVGGKRAEGNTKVFGLSTWSESGH